MTALSEYLVEPVKGELEQVKSIYQWLIWNINYDQKAFKDGNKRINRSNEDILKRKEAICWGYASLFQAMCEEIGITAEIISGYSRSKLTDKPSLESQNHAWNAVKIDGQWYLVDATWDSGHFGYKSDFEKRFGHNYFLTPPKYFVVNHLPADPVWQLLDCPIYPDDYQLEIEALVKRAQRTDCEEFLNLSSFEKLPIQDKKLLSAIKAYQFNPTKANKRELAHVQMDYETYLTEISERLQQVQKFDSLLIIQKEMVQLCETASQLTNLFDSQLENCAYNHFNYAVTLAMITADNKSASLQKWQEVNSSLEKAKNQLAILPQNIFTENALNHCNEYMEYARSNIAALNKKRK